MTIFNKLLIPFLLLKNIFWGSEKKLIGIVHKDTVVGSSLVFLIALMTFLAFITIGSVNLINNVLFKWQGSLMSEATIILRPDSNFFSDIHKSQLELQARAEKAQKIASVFPKVLSVTLLPQEESLSLLKPWFGVLSNLEKMPVPRLLLLSVNPADPPNYSLLQQELLKAIPNILVDDHKPWFGQIVSIAKKILYFCSFLLLLVLTICIIAIIFATKAALGANEHVVEVLYFIGAQANFIAQQFNYYFIWVAIQGIAWGSSAALLVLFALSKWFKLGFFANNYIYLHFFLTYITILLIVLITSHYTILSQLRIKNYLIKEH
ncbi:cell division protein FtsX [Bartonella sp. DGB1]|uniref:cell division protein FtsX n=1 Tax=Bartonella sp. DGB1 TaxID=3239807 RepID=UPI0035238D4E